MICVSLIQARAIRSLAPALLALCLVLMPAQSTQAISFDSTGNVMGWGITPFSQANGNTSASGITSIRQNNYSPLSYPNGIGHQPSPGGTTGEKFDLEEVHIRNNGSQVQVLLIASSLFQATASGSTLNLGDLMIDLNNDHQFELGVVTQSGNAGLDAGRLYEVHSTLGLQNLSGSYRGTSIDTQIGAWAVGTGLGHDLFAIETASHNFGGSEGVTYAYQYTFDLNPLNTLPSQFAFQIAWGCGNDVILGDYTLTQPPIRLQETTPIPEPAPLALFVVIAWVGLSVLGRMRRPMRMA